MHVVEGRGDRQVRLLSVAIAALFALSVIGLVTQDSGDPDIESVADAADATIRTGTAAVRFTVEVEADGSTFTTTGEGVVDFEGNRAALTMRVADRDPVDVVLVGAETYQRIDPRGPKPWALMPPSPMTGPFVGAADPRGPALVAVAMLGDKGSFEVVRRAGVDEVGGVRTDRYVGSVDHEAEGSDGTTPGRGHGLPLSMRFLPSTLEVWVADDGLIRRFRTAVVAGMDDLTYRMHLSLDLHDFGAPVRIDVPPPDQVRPPGA